MNAAPFAPGDRVYLARHPDRGSVTVETCTREEDGSWRVSTRGAPAPGLATYLMSAPAEQFRPVPPGWAEPPPVPEIVDCPAATALSLDLWRRMMTQWQAGFERNAAAGDSNG